MPKCIECGTNVGDPNEFYYCPTCGGPLCNDDRKDHTHAD